MSDPITPITPIPPQQDIIHNMDTVGGFLQAGLTGFTKAMGGNNSQKPTQIPTGAFIIGKNQLGPKAEQREKQRENNRKVIKS